MHPADRHRKAIEQANTRTFKHTGIHGPYDPEAKRGSKEKDAHEFWLDCYDEFAIGDTITA